MTSLRRALAASCIRLAQRLDPMLGAQKQCPLPDVELVTGLQREARELHGPKLTPYTRRLKALR
jgi:hypothetical protein